LGKCKTNRHSERTCKKAKENQGTRTDICQISDKGLNPIDTKKELAKKAKENQVARKGDQAGASCQISDKLMVQIDTKKELARWLNRDDPWVVFGTSRRIPIKGD